jgi:hypothetical protein
LIIFREGVGRGRGQKGTGVKKGAGSVAYRGKTGKTGKTGKSRRRRKEGSQNIKACRIENTLKVVTSS